MFEDLWGFQASPFLNVSTTRFFFRSRVHEEAVARMDYVVRRAKGAMLLLGAEGTGKTQVLRFYADACAQSGRPVALLKFPCATAKELLTQALAGFGLPPRDEPLPALLAAVEAYCLEGFAAEKPKVLLVDDADRHAEGDVFSALRLLQSFETEEGRPLAIVLAGTPALRTRPDFAREMGPRIEVQHTLLPLDAEETRAYVRDHLAKAGGAAEIFQGTALELIAQASGGVPRKINALCDACLFIAGGEGKKTVDRNIVAQAIVELRDLLAA